MWLSTCSAPCVEGTIFFLFTCLCIFIKEKMTPWGVSLFLGSLFCTADPFVYFSTTPHSFGHRRFVGLSMSAVGPVALFFSIVLAILGLLPFHMYFRVTAVTTSKFFTCLTELTSFFKTQNVNWRQLDNTSLIWESGFLEAQCYISGTTIKDTWTKPRQRVEAAEGGGFGWGRGGGWGENADNSNWTTIK